MGLDTQTQTQNPNFFGCEWLIRRGLKWEFFYWLIKFFTANSAVNKIIQRKKNPDRLITYLNLPLLFNWIYNSSIFKPYENIKVSICNNKNYCSSCKTVLGRRVWISTAIVVNIIFKSSFIITSTTATVIFIS